MKRTTSDANNKKKITICIPFVCLELLNFEAFLVSRSARPYIVFTVTHITNVGIVLPTSLLPVVYRDLCNDVPGAAVTD